MPPDPFPKFLASKPGLGSSLDGVGLETKQSSHSTGGHSETDYGLSYL